MKSIVKLKLNYLKEVVIQESTGIIDHRNHYNITFDNCYSPKDLYGSVPYQKKWEFGVVLYVNSIKYYENPDYYINLIKNYKEYKIK